MYGAEDVKKAQLIKKARDRYLTAMKGEYTTEGKDQIKNALAFSVYNYGRIGSGPFPLVVEAMQKVSRDLKQYALDLGAGALIETNYILKEGFRHVTAVDQYFDEHFTREMHANAVTCVQSSIENWHFPINKFGLVNAMFVLHYLDKDKLPIIIQRIFHALKYRGVFVGTLFGPQDFRVGGLHTCAVEKEQVEVLLGDFSTVTVHEIKGLRLMANRKKRMVHVFRIIAQKKR